MKVCRLVGGVVVASAALAQAVPATAANGGVVGWVENTRGVPLSGAVISIFGQGIRGNRVTLSDSEGQFVLPALPPGSYTLRAVSTGHEPSAARHITVLPDRDAQFTVSLAPVDEDAAARARAEAESESTTALREWLWLMRHKRRSVLESMAERGDSTDRGSIRLQFPAAAPSVDPGALDGSLEVAAATPSGATLAPDSVGAVRLRGRLAEGVRWTLAGLAAENEGRAWRMAAQFLIEPGGGHEIVAGAGYGAGATRTSLADGLAQPDRTSGAVFARSRVRFGDKVRAIAGGRYTYVGFLTNSHHADAILEVEVEGSPGTILRGSISTRALVPGGDLLTLSTVAASPAITWARLEDGLRTAHAIRYQLDLDRSVGASRVGAQVFDERVSDVLLTTFQGGSPVFANRGRAGAQGLAVTLGHRLGSVAEASVRYTFGRTHRLGHPWAERTTTTAFDEAAFHDLTVCLETMIDWTDTRLSAVYRLNATSDIGWGAEPNPRAMVSRFDVQLTQGLPFLQPLTRADWELLIAIRNMFYEASQVGFLEELAVREPPTRVVGGVSVRF